jgi:membrane associated rhomboid family serine protease
MHPGSSITCSTLCHRTPVLIQPSVRPATSRRGAHGAPQTQRLFVPYGAAFVLVVLYGLQLASLNLSPIMRDLLFFAVGALTAIAGVTALLAVYLHVKKGRLLARVVYLRSRFKNQ